MNQRRSLSVAARFTFGILIWLVAVLVIITDDRFDPPNRLPRFVFWVCVALLYVLVIAIAATVVLVDEYSGGWIMLACAVYLLEGFIFLRLYGRSSAFIRMRKQLKLQSA
jgi:hypothetical protein